MKYNIDDKLYCYNNKLEANVFYSDNDRFNIGDFYTINFLGYDESDKTLFRINGVLFYENDLEKYFYTKKELRLHKLNQLDLL